MNFKGKCWLRGNLHLHSDQSDGHLTIAQVARKYAQAGYDFIALSDHWRTFLADANGPLPLVVLNGMELDGFDRLGSYYHVLVIGLKQTISSNGVIENALGAAREQGALLFWAHPHWTGNSLEEGLRHPFDGMEIYNHSSQCEIGKGGACHYWDAILESRPEFSGIAVDDAHFSPGEPFWKGGWIMVNVDRKSAADIVAAIRNGNFYATQGPTLRAFVRRAGRIEIEMTPVKFARLLGPRSLGKWVYKASTFEKAVFRVPDNWPWARIEIEDSEGHRAWTNALRLQA